MSNKTASQTALRSLAGEPWLADPSLQALMQALGGRDGLTRIVGGSVRNALIGLPVADVDMASELEPGEVARRAEAAGFKCVPTGIDHGTVTVVAGGRPFEVTTLRHDVETDGRRAKVAFTDDWAADASRRDFTINALYLDMDGTVFDPLGGAGDVLARRVRFIGDAAARIAEDYLRILRFFRFSAVFSSGALDPEGLAACIRARAGLTGLSAERVRQELLKLLAAPKPLPVVTAFCDTGLYPLLLGGVPYLASFSAYLDIEAAHGLSGDALRRLCVLSCLVVEDADRLRERLRLSNAEHARLIAAVSGFRKVRPFMSARDAKTGLYRAGAEAWRDRVALAWCRSLHADEIRWGELYDLPDRWTVPSLPWRGADLAVHGVKPGIGMGDMLRLLETRWIAADFPEGAADRADILAEVLGESGSGEEFAD